MADKNIAETVQIRKCYEHNPIVDLVMGEYRGNEGAVSSLMEEDKGDWRKPRSDSTIDYLMAEEK